MMNDCPSRERQANSVDRADSSLFINRETQFTHTEPLDQEQCLNARVPLGPVESPSRFPLRNWDAGFSTTELKLESFYWVLAFCRQGIPSISKRKSIAKVLFEPSHQTCLNRASVIGYWLDWGRFQEAALREELHKRPTATDRALESALSVAV